MQYILSEDEYKELVEYKRRCLIVDKLIGKDLHGLQTLCEMVANHVPVEDGWYKGKSWGCIHTVGDEWYCDDCPAKKMCPSGKNWSK